MTKILKHRLKQFTFWFVRNNGIAATIAFIIILIMWKLNASSTSLFDWFDFSVLSSIVFAIIIAIIGNMINNFVNSYIEDEVKLTTDYKTLANQYIDDLFEYNNSVEDGVDPKNLDLLLNKSDVSQDHKNISSYDFRFPITEDAKSYKKSLVIHDSHEEYVLPDIIQEHFDQLVKSHSSTLKYNQLMIRVDDWYEDNNTFHIHTSRTSYLQSLVTNRSIDYRWENGLSNRKWFDYGPFVTTLKESELSNHLGFNGFIESSDGYIPLMQRSSKVSVGKRTSSPSVSGSAKTKYALDDDHVFTTDGLERAILSEIFDEIKIEKKDLEWEGLEKSIIRWYRDLVEGGKPHFLFYVKSKNDRETIENNFKGNGKKNKNVFDVQLQMLEDGEQMVWIHKSELSQLAISPSYIVHKQVAYKTLPSYSSCLGMLINHLKSIDEIN